MVFSYFEHEKNFVSVYVCRVYETFLSRVVGLKCFDLPPDATFGESVGASMNCTRLGIFRLGLLAASLEECY